MASNVGRYAKAATDLSDAASVRKFLSRDFPVDQIDTWAGQLRTALASAKSQPRHPEQPANSSSARSEVAARQATLETQRRRLIAAARNLTTELNRTVAALEPFRRHLRPHSLPGNVASGESPEVAAHKAFFERIQDASFVSTHLGIPLSLAALDFGTLTRSLDQTTALVEKLTRWSRFEKPPKKPTKPSKGVRKAARARDDELATFLALVAHAKLKPKQLAAIECLALNSFAVTRGNRSDVAWAATKIREWEKTLARTKNQVEYLVILLTTYSPELSDTAVTSPLGE